MTQPEIIRATTELFKARILLPTHTPLQKRTPAGIARAPFARITASPAAQAQPFRLAFQPDFPTTGGFQYATIPPQRPISFNAVTASHQSHTGFVPTSHRIAVRPPYGMTAYPRSKGMKRQWLCVCLNFYLNCEKGPRKEGSARGAAHGTNNVR